MKVLVVSGSHRVNSHSGRIAQILVNMFLPKVFDTVKFHDLSTLKIPFWDEGIWEKNDMWTGILEPIHCDLSEADAFVFIVPEWSGMAAPMVKNYFLLGNQKLMGHKPSLLVSISSGLGGSYPIQELRISSYKNTRVCHIPEHVIVRNVETVFTGHNSDNDQRLADRFDFCCAVLAAYAKALRTVRDSNIDWDKYPYGM